MKTQFYVTVILLTLLLAAALGAVIGAIGMR